MIKTRNKKDVTMCECKSALNRFMWVIYVVAMFLLLVLRTPKLILSFSSMYLFLVITYSIAFPRGQGAKTLIIVS